MLRWFLYFIKCISPPRQFSCCCIKYDFLRCNNHCSCFRRRHSINISKPRCSSSCNPNSSKTSRITTLLGNLSSAPFTFTVPGPTQLQDNLSVRGVLSAFIMHTPLHFKIHYYPTLYVHEPGPLRDTPWGSRFFYCSLSCVCVQHPPSDTDARVRMRTNNKFVCIVFPFLLLPHASGTVDSGALCLPLLPLPSSELNSRRLRTRVSGAAVDSPHAICSSM